MPQILASDLAARAAAVNEMLHQRVYIRDVQEQLTPNDTQRTTLIVAGIYVLVIAILWHVPYLKVVIYPFKLLTVGFHEMSHAFVGVLTCAKIHSIELDPDEGGVTRMKGGIAYLTLPAGYLGSSFIGACLIACGFNTNASKVASLILAVFFIFTLWWARRNWLYAMIFSFRLLVYLMCFWDMDVDPWDVGFDRPLLVLFIGVMSCMYVLWDISDDTLRRKVNTSDASEFARICGGCGSRLWGAVWLIVAIVFFALGILVGLAAFKQNSEQQKADAAKFLRVPGTSGAFANSPTGLASACFSLFLVMIALL